jgi:N-acetylglucosaminyl-diphospho-decaprenol L-rhamnosyltransferase
LHASISSDLYSLWVVSSNGGQQIGLPTVAVVVLRLGSRPISQELTDALNRFRLECGPISIVVAENRDAEACEELDEATVDLTVRFESNLGYAAAMNEAIRQQGSDSQVILVLTNDVTICRGSFKALVARFDDPTIGIVAPALQTNSETWLGGTWSPTWGWARHQVSNGFNERAHHELLPTIWADGACLAIDRSAYEAIGGFDDRTFLYGEDLLFCLQARQMGKRVVIAPDVVLRQESGMSQRSGAHGYLLVRNEVLVARTVPGTRWLGVVASGVARSGLELLRSLRGNAKRHHLKQSVGMMWGLFDAFRGHYGPPPDRLARMARIPAINRITSSSSAPVA